MGRPLKGRESQKTCLKEGCHFADRRSASEDLRIKKGNPRIE
jgi:hypothetical protein